jgi:hypothetical protein
MGRRRLGARHVQIALRRRQDAHVHVHHQSLAGLQVVHTLAQRVRVSPIGSRPFGGDHSLGAVRPFEQAGQLGEH